jgi:hypothetical protein
MLDNRSEGLLVRAEPLRLARQVCQRLVEEVREADGALLLAADPALAAAINTVLVKKGLKISELHRMEFLKKSKGVLTTV